MKPIASALIVSLSFFACIACQPSSSCQKIAHDNVLRIADRVELDAHPPDRSLTEPRDVLIWAKEDLPHGMHVSAMPGDGPAEIPCSPALRSLPGKVALLCFRIEKTSDVEVFLDGDESCPTIEGKESIHTRTRPRVFRFTVQKRGAP